MNEAPSPSQIEKQEQQLIESRTKRKAINAEVIQPQQLEGSTQPNPIPMQTTDDLATKDQKIMRERGSIIPMIHARPQAPQLNREEGSVIVARALAEQLGTDPMLKAQMKIDERKMAVTTALTVPALAHFSYRYTYDGVRYWGHCCEWILTGSQGVGGLARRHILQAIGSSSGVSMVEKAEKPNILARNLTQRDWKKKAEAEGKVVEE